MKKAVLFVVLFSLAFAAPASALSPTDLEVAASASADPTPTTWEVKGGIPSIELPFDGIERICEDGACNFYAMEDKVIDALTESAEPAVLISVRVPAPECPMGSERGSVNCPMGKLEGPVRVHLAGVLGPRHPLGVRHADKDALQSAVDFALVIIARLRDDLARGLPSMDIKHAEGDDMTLEITGGAPTLKVNLRTTGVGGGGFDAQVKRILSDDWGKPTLPSDADVSKSEQ